VGLFVYRAFAYGESSLEIALLPFRIFFQGEDGNPKLFDGRLNPFLLILPFCLLLPGGKQLNANVRLEKVTLAAFVLLYFCFALFSTDMRVRYLAPTIPPLVILSTYGLHHLMVFSSRVPGMLKYVIIAAPLMLLFIWNMTYVIGLFRYVDPFPYLKGTLSRDEYISRYRPEHSAMQFINCNLPDTALVLFLFIGNRGYYCDRDYVLGEEGFRNLVRESDRPDELWSGLKARGITHLLIYLQIYDKWVGGNFGPEESETLRGFHKDFAKMISFVDDPPMEPHEAVHNPLDPFG
jgi:hypothetical protein